MANTPQSEFFKRDLAAFEKELVTVENDLEWATERRTKVKAHIEQLKKELAEALESEGKS